MLLGLMMPLGRIRGPFPPSADIEQGLHEGTPLGNSAAQMNLARSRLCIKRHCAKSALRAGKRTMFTKTKVTPPASRLDGTTDEKLRAYLWDIGVTCDGRDWEFKSR
jgi:hypothetical protein